MKQIILALIKSTFEGEGTVHIVREVTTIASVAMPVGERWGVRRCRYVPQGDSRGRVCLATGMHGDETMGQLIVYGVVTRIMSQPENLHGTIDVYPMLNPLGLDVGDRMVPATAQLDMNRVFPGSLNGTALESLCHRVFKDMLGADLVLDIHASTHFKSELYEARLCARDGQRLFESARSLCPELIWVMPDRNDFDASLVGALSAQGTNAMIVEADERRRHPEEIADRVVDGIFCALHKMGIWTGDTVAEPEDVPCIHGPQGVLRFSCDRAGVYVPQDCIGKWVKEGELLGEIIDALEGVCLEQVRAPADGLVFSQRSYSPVYPGTLIARLYRKEQPQP